MAMNDVDAFEEYSTAYFEKKVVICLLDAPNISISVMCLSSYLFDVGKSFANVKIHVRMCYLADFIRASPRLYACVGEGSKAGLLVFIYSVLFFLRCKRDSTLVLL